MLRIFAFEFNLITSTVSIDPTEVSIRSAPNGAGSCERGAAPSSSAATDSCSADADRCWGRRDLEFGAPCSEEKLKTILTQKTESKTYPSEGNMVGGNQIRTPQIGFLFLRVTKPPTPSASILRKTSVQQVHLMLLESLCPLPKLRTLHGVDLLPAEVEVLPRSDLRTVRSGSPRGVWRVQRVQRGLGDLLGDAEPVGRKARRVNKLDLMMR